MAGDAIRNNRQAQAMEMTGKPLTPEEEDSFFLYDFFGLSAVEEAWSGKDSFTGEELKGYRRFEGVVNFALGLLALRLGGRLGGSLAPKLKFGPRFKFGQEPRPTTPPGSEPPVQKQPGSQPQAKADATPLDKAADAPNGLSGRQGLRYDPKHLNKHLPDTAESAKLIQKEGSAHVFNDEATLRHVEQAILERGEATGSARGWERFGLRFDEPIGYRIDAQGNKIPLYYGELKLDPKTGKYHVTPRTGPATGGEE
jgi:hypothetical protein